MRVTSFILGHINGLQVGICSFSLPCYPTPGTNFSFSLSSWAQRNECPKVSKLGSGRARIQIQQQEVLLEEGGSSCSSPFHRHHWTVSYEGPLSSVSPPASTKLIAWTETRHWVFSLPNRQDLNGVSPRGLCTCCSRFPELYSREPQDYLPVSSKKLFLTSASKIASHHFISLPCFSFLHITYYIVLYIGVCCFVFLCLLAISPLH